ncbi:cytochrome P450 [[Mycobacterium] burgundiense]|uniref:Cytochrome P450 n=1 Tax=[Mycobacterium] burgundiense TaxID=3064286 RepID=A0ABM9LK99_9MYCO|nr:cytochrome P450 [Mycolicibacterium sp. MU0053]CAJ1500534.1 cytochrome P450 [Mycolicibacterium sp. MU0053]
MSAKPVVSFDHHSAEFANESNEILSDLRKRCPVAWTEAHGGYWVITEYDDLAAIARDDQAYSSQHDLEGPKQGVLIPPIPNPSGILEMDPPGFRKIRRALAPYFSPAAIKSMREEILDLTTQCIDDFIERGEADLIEELASPVPAMLTVRLLGLPMSEWPALAEAFHKGAYLPHDEEHMGDIQEMLMGVYAQLSEAVKQRRAKPQDDLISALANLEIDGELVPLEVATGNLQLLAAGGIDTTTSLMAHTFMHLDRVPADREYLLGDLSRTQLACEEFLRVYPPIPGMARTVTVDHKFADQEFSQNDRVWFSWGSANRDEKLFDNPDEVRLDRFPNRHTSFGLGAHRCLGSNMARTVWEIVVGEVLTRLPDFRVDRTAAQRYPDCGEINGWVSVPVSFSPGKRIRDTAGK